MPTLTIYRADSAGLVEQQPLRLSFVHVVYVFVFVSAVGLLGETLVSYVIDGRWESRAGFLFLPLSSIYGVGAVLITLAVNPLRGKNPILQVLAAAVVGGVLEYTAGWLLEVRYGIVAWSYIDQPLNFHGHASVAVSLVWGVIGFAWVRWGLPVVVRAVDRLPQRPVRLVAKILLVLLVVDGAMTLVAFDCWFLRTSGVPVEGAIQQFFAAHFDDTFMASRFETMSMWPSLASRW